MEEAIAGEAVTSGALSAFGEYGLPGLVIVALLIGAYKFGMKWVDLSVKREERDAEARKKTYESLNGLSAAINRNTETSERNTQAIVAMSGSMGRLPCTHRDPSLRTRTGDRHAV